MKRFIYTICIMLAANSILAQTLDDIGRLSISIQRPNYNNIPTEALDILEDKMSQIITLNGISDNSFNKRFALIATVSVMKKDIISGPSVRVSQTIQIVFYVKDVIDGKQYGNAVINTVGVGANENKSYIMAFNNVKVADPRIQGMIEDSKKLIVSYYRTNIEGIISEARSMAQQGKYDNALYLLAQVPDICAECTEISRKATIEIYQEKIDSEGLHLLQQAKAKWSSSPNANGAVEATQFLAKVNLLASCRSEVENLMQEMKNKVKDDERKVWEFELQRYADEKAREQRDYEFRVRQYEENLVIEQARYEDELAREQRNFEFQVHKFDAEYAKDMAIISASREVALEVAKQLPNVNINE